MKYEELITVIVPCYNASQYLPKLSEDLQKQEFQNFEVLFVNDGDDSQNEVLEQIKKSDARFYVFYKENGGVSSARNLGLDYAHGEWITFVDADDRISSTYLSCLARFVELHPDIIIGGLSIIDQQGNIRKKSIIDEVEILEKKTLFRDSFKYIENRDDLRTPCARLYRNSILANYKIRFDTKYRVAEDWLFNLEYYPHVNHAVYISDTGYRYIWGNSSSSICSYDNSHVEVRLLAIEKLSQLRKTMGRSAYEIEKAQDKDLTQLCFSMLKNLYCTRNHPSLFDSISYINKQLIGNSAMGSALGKTEVTKTTDRLQKLIIQTKCAWFIACSHYILYKCRHR